MTDARKKFIEFLDNYICYGFDNNIIIIAGPKGIGKTSTLIFYSFLKENRVFYVNLEALCINRSDLKEKDLLMELAKLYGPFYNNDDGKSKTEIEDYIRKNYDKLDGLEIILNIISKFIPFVNFIQYNFCFIIDQVSLSNKYKNIDTLYNIMDEVKTCPFLKLIICTTLDIDFSNDSIMNNIFKSGISFQNNDLYSFYYFQNFISKEDIIDKILNNENDEMINIMNELGFWPGHFYEIKRDNNTKNYIHYLENNINYDLQCYYEEKNIPKLLELIDLIYGEKIISGNMLSQRIREIPLKYIIIKKFKISQELIEWHKRINKDDNFLEYLSLLLYDLENVNCDEIFEDYYDFIEINGDDFISEYLEKDKDSRNLFGDFYGDYIRKHIINFGSPQKEIYGYKIEFSTDLIQKILFDKIHEYLQSQYLTFLKLFSNGVIVGFFEVLINYSFIKNNFKLFNNKIDEIIQIDRIVPYHFSIKNYSSKREKIKFKRFTMDETKKKRKLPDKNIYVFQKIFNSKYYDAAILLKTSKSGVYDIIVIQITIKKDKEKRFDKNEHEIIITYVKKNIENKFDIKIRNSYFFYVLSEKDGIIEDSETKEDCDIKGIKYIGYDINNKRFNVYCKNLDDAFITNSYPIHNCVTFYDMKKLKENNTNEINIINELDFSGFCEIDEKTFNLIKLLFDNKEKSYELKKEQFKRKNFTNKISVLKQINIPLTYFSIYLLKKIVKKKEEIFIKFIDKYYKYIGGIFKNVEFKLNDIEEIYLIHSEIPLSLKI